MWALLRNPAFVLVAVALTSTLDARAATARAQTTLLLRVVDSATRRPLPNAEVSADGRRGLTDGLGEVRVLWPASGALHVRVRQLGFRYVERDLRRDAASTVEEDTVVIALARMQWSLPQVVVQAEQKCPEDRGENVALSQASMELLRLGAEQFDNFRRTYPYELTLERRSVPRQLGRPPVDTEVTSSATWGDRYVPDSVVMHVSANEYFVPLLFVSALADSAFWDRHCFRARGVESHDGRRLIRLDFFPALGVRVPEWEGAAWLDSARSVLARIDFRLTNLRGFEGPQRFEGFTVFSTPSPFIAIPDSTVAWWTTAGRGPFGSTQHSTGRQTYALRTLRYTRREPPSRQ